MTRLRSTLSPFPWPRIGSLAMVTGCVVVSLLPSLLPRSSLLQGVFTGLLAAVGLGVAGCVRILLRACGLRGPNQLRASTRPQAVALAAAVAVTTAAACSATHWQNTLRAAMGIESVGVAHWAVVLTVAATLFVVLRGICRGCGRAARRLGPGRGLAAALAITLGVTFVGLPSLVDWRYAVYAAADSDVDPTLAQPISLQRSGSALSAIDWAALGAQGRKFVSVGTSSDSVRVYVGIRAAADQEARAALAVRELARAGGLRRNNIVLAVPTGSGWIDANAVTGFEQRFHGDVALVGMQYSFAPSWATFLFGRRAASESARALFEAVADRLADLPTAQRPRLYLYGQSLGATGGSSVLRDVPDARGHICAALWAGPPAGQVHPGAATVLANSSDPVVRWSPRLVLHPPSPDGLRTDAPRPQWIPIVDFLQTTVDLLSALDPPAGHGHRYGNDQGTAMGSCAGSVPDASAVSSTEPAAVTRAWSR